MVSKLRENAKAVIGVGVKQSTSDLLINNCDEFIFYGDLVAEQPTSRRRQRGRGRGRASTPARKKPVDSTASSDDPPEQESTAAPDDQAQQAIDLVLQTAEAIYAERGDRAKLWGSMIKQTLKRRRPGFNESTYGFGSFNDLLEEAQTRGHLDLDLDERSGGYGIGRIVRD